MWSKNPKLEEATLSIIANGYQEKVNQKSVPLAVWDSIAGEVIKAIDLAETTKSQITGTSIRTFFRGLKKSFLEYSKEY